MNGRKRDRTSPRSEKIDLPRLFPMPNLVSPTRESQQIRLSDVCPSEPASPGILSSISQQFPIHVSTFVGNFICIIINPHRVVNTYAKEYTKKPTVSNPIKLKANNSTAPSRGRFHPNGGIVSISLFSYLFMDALAPTKPRLPRIGQSTLATQRPPNAVAASQLVPMRHQQAVGPTG